jgi:biopolymer transport protein ExbD
MAASSNSDADEMIVGINVTPLVDVVLVLLVIFMIAAPVIYQSSIKVELPRAASGEKSEHITLRFSMLESGELKLGNDPITMEQIPVVVKKALEQDPTANAMIAADRNLRHGTVITLIDAIKTNGMRQLGIAVDSPTVERKTQ